MINLKEYLSINEEENRFEIPGTFWEKVIFVFLTKYLSNMDFIGRLYVDDNEYTKLYWRKLFESLRKDFKIKKISSNQIFFGKSMGYAIRVEAEKFYGFGQSKLNKNIAISKSIGEFLERFYLSEPGNEIKKRIRLLKYGDMKKKVSLIRDFNDFSEEQYLKLNLKKTDESELVECVEVEELISFRREMYPASYIYRKHEYLKYSKLYKVTTNSCSGFFDRKTAILNAIYEAVERDGFMCYWLTKTPLRKIILEKGFSDIYDNQYSLFKEKNFKLEVFETTTDLDIFSCICIVTDVRTGGYVMSGGADLNPKLAIEKAVSESCGTSMYYLTNEKVEMLQKDFVPFVTKGINLERRRIFAKNGLYKDKLKISKGEEVNFKDIKFFNKYEGCKVDELEHVLEIFRGKKNNYDKVYVYDVNEGKLSKYGFFVVRVIIPKFFPLYLEENLALVNSERLRDFSFYKNATTEFEINTFPHPFP